MRLGYLFSALLLFAASVSFGAAQQSIVPTANAAYELNRTSSAAHKYSAGSVLKEAHNTAVGVWDYSLTGGVAGAYSTGITLPAKSIIRKVFFDVVTSPTSAGGTIAFHAVSANDLKTATASASWTDRVDGALDGAVANFIKITSAKTVYATLVSTYSAGKIKVFVDYTVSE